MRRVVEGGLHARVPLEDICPMVSVPVSVEMSRAFIASCDVGASVLDLLATLRDGADAVVVEFDDLRDFIYIDRKTTLAAGATLLARAGVYRGGP